MIKIILKKLLKKHGSIGLLSYIGDFITSQTKSKKHDKLWAEIKKLIKNFDKR